MKRIIEKVAFPVPEQPKALRVAAYARVSCGKDAMLHSLSAQVSYYSAMIQNHPGWLYCGVYVDEALTGTKETRDSFQRLLTDCRADKIDLVITKSISRFARNTVTLLEAVRELRNIGVDVFFEEQNLHTVGADGELIMTILASYAQEESLSASENQKWKIRKAYENGEQIMIRRLYGYKVSKGSLVIDPEKADIVREIFRRVLEGDSFSSIADDLNERNVFCNSGKGWTAVRIRKLLENEKYTGNALLQKRFRNNHLEKRMVKNNGELPMYYAEDTHEALISMKDFEQVQEILRRNDEATHSRKKPECSAFTGLIRCELCGANYRRRTNNGLVFWDCSTYAKRGSAGCRSRRIHEDMLYEITAGVAPFEEIEQITAGEGVLTYSLKDGCTVTREWQLLSRSASWTDEMKQAAGQLRKKGGSEKTWQEQ